MLSIYHWHYFSTNMNITLSTSNIVICYSPVLPKHNSQHSDRLHLKNHPLYCLYNYKRSSLPRITTPRHLQRDFPFTNYNTSFLVNPDNKTSNPIPTVHTSQTFSGSRHLPLCNRLLPERPDIHKPHPLLLQPFPVLSVYAFSLFATPYAHADANSRANKSHTTRLDTKFPYRTPTYNVTGKCNSHDAHSRLLPTIHLVLFLPAIQPVQFAQPHLTYYHPPHILLPTSPRYLLFLLPSPRPPHISPELNRIWRNYSFGAANASV